MSFARLLLLVALGLAGCATRPEPANPFEPSNPVEAYYLRCQEAMRPIWNREIAKRADLLSLGETVLRFDVSTKGGHPRNVRVVSNTGPETLAEIAVRVATTAEMPPMPPDVAAVLNNQSFHVEYSFAVHR